MVALVENEEEEIFDRVDLLHDKRGVEEDLAVPEVNHCSTTGLVQLNVGNVPPDLREIVSTPDLLKVLGGDEHVKIALGTYKVTLLDLRLDLTQIVSSHTLLFGLPPDSFSKK
jgi:hypothetical protein